MNKKHLKNGVIKTFLGAGILLGGAAAGAVGGAAIGSVVPVVGTAAGAALGSAALLAVALPIGGPMIKEGIGELKLAFKHTKHSEHHAKHKLIKQAKHSNDEIDQVLSHNQLKLFKHYAASHAHALPIKPEVLPAIAELKIMIQ